MEVYNRKYADYKTQIAAPNLTDNQKKVLADRKSVLLKVCPLVAMYDLAVAGGQTPTKAGEDSIVTLLNQLGAHVK